MGEHTPRFAILASGDQAGGGGSTANKVARDALEGKVDFTIGVVICQYPPGTSGVYSHFEQINKEFGLKGYDKIDVEYIGPGRYPDRPQPRGQTLQESEEVCKLLKAREIDLAPTIGWMRILTGQFIEEWGWQPEYATDPRYSFRSGLYHPNARIPNNHPAILPFTADTHGPGAHQAAFGRTRPRVEGLRRFTTMSWHLSSESIDAGPIIQEDPIEILPADNAMDVEAKVMAHEKKRTAFVLQDHARLREEHRLGNS